MPIALIFNLIRTENRIEHYNIKDSAPISPILIDDTNPSSDWTWAMTQPWFGGGLGIEGSPYVIKDLIIDGGGISSCIKIENSIAHFRIQNCTLYNTGGTTSAGIELSNVSNGILYLNNCSIIDYGIYLYQSHYNHLEGNIIEGDSSASGINLQLSNNNTIGSNIIKCKKQGIRLETSSENLITDNTVENCDNFGILLMTNSHHNTVSSNTANNQTLDSGIMVLNSDHNFILENSAYYNKKVGIEIDGSRFNLVSNNTINNNIQAGISLWTNLGSKDSDDNNVTGNIIYGNNNGIFLSNSSNNDILNNELIDNYMIGAAIGYNSNNNLFSNNYFLMNGNHAVDHGTNNVWNSSTRGNYWDNYTGWDDDDNGIGDIPYIIPGDANSEDMMPLWDDAEPIIDILTPLPDSVFSSTAPQFLVNIYDLNLDKMWYTLNGLTTKMLFITNGTIDQNIWNLNSDGTLTISFCANDTFGNTAFSEVVVSKDSQGPIISIITPNMNEVFTNPPNYEISITEPHLDKIWYTFDGGKNKIFTTELFNTLDSNLWNQLPNGDVSIRFYANDTLGQVSFEEVIVVKNTQSTPSNRIPGYDISILLVLISVFSALIIKNKRNKR